MNGKAQSCQHCTRYWVLQPQTMEILAQPHKVTSRATTLFHLDEERCTTPICLAFRPRMLLVATNLPLSSKISCQHSESCFVTSGCARLQSCWTEEVCTCVVDDATRRMLLHWLSSFCNSVSCTYRAHMSWYLRWQKSYTNTTSHFRTLYH